MIKFFRKIRQKTLTENKFGKYLIYAIGEILLVVIGILLALQVNNWNESKRLNKIERKYLQELKSNLQMDIEDINHSVSFTSDKIKSNHIVLEYLDGEETFHDTLKSHFANIAVSLHFTAQTSAITGIKTTEGISIIQNDSLRKAIIHNYDFMYEHIKYIEKEDEHKFQYHILRPTLNNNLKQNYYPSEAEPIDIVDIKNNVNFRNVISTNIWYKELMLYNYKTQLRTVTDLIQHIEDELGKTE